MNAADMLAKYLIPYELLEAAGVRHAIDAEVRDLLGIHGRNGQDLSGIVFPYRDPRDGHVVSHRIRLDAPRDGQRYLSEQGCRTLFFSPIRGKELTYTSIPVVIVEAEKSALALTALAGRHARKLLAIAAGGVWGWKRKTGTELQPDGTRQSVSGPSPSLDWITWKGRKTIIIFDSNVAGRWELQKARRELARELGSRGAEVCIGEVPAEPDVNGPDDLIAISGDEVALQLIDEAKPAIPTIDLRPGLYPQAVDEAEEVLLEHVEQLRLFQRGGELVRIVCVEKTQCGGGLRRETGAMILAPLSTVALTEIFDRLINWQRISSTENGPRLRRVDCPGRIAVAYLSRIGSWRLPVLMGISSAPIMRPDGTILHQSGYDPQTRLFLTEDWPELDDNPTRDDSLAALQKLKAPFMEFPFVAPEDESVLIAAILTVVQRRLLASSPLFGFTAPTQRTGKSLLAECVAITASGVPAAAMAVASDREEIRKAVAAALREGHAIVNLDNVEHPLGSPDLSRAITQPEYGDRVLGETRILRLPTNVLWTATGNNLTFRGDLAVRALVCRLDAKLERPEERMFTIADLKKYVAEHRRELVTAAIAIMRAYVVAGRPDQRLTPWGGFDEWSATIRAPLVWVGMSDPCATRQRVLEDDPDREQATALLSAWHNAFRERNVTVGEVLETAENDPDLK